MPSKRCCGASLSTAPVRPATATGPALPARESLALRLAASMCSGTARLRWRCAASWQRSWAAPAWPRPRCGSSHPPAGSSAVRSGPWSAWLPWRPWTLVAPSCGLATTTRLPSLPCQPLPMRRRPASGLISRTSSPPARPLPWPGRPWALTTRSSACGVAACQSTCPRPLLRLRRRSLALPHHVPRPLLLLWPLLRPRRMLAPLPRCGLPAPPRPVASPLPRPVRRSLLFLPRDPASRPLSSFS